MKLIFVQLTTSRKPWAHCVFVFGKIEGNPSCCFNFGLLPGKLWFKLTEDLHFSLKFPKQPGYLPSSLFTSVFYREPYVHVPRFGGKVETFHSTQIAESSSFSFEGHKENTCIFWGTRNVVTCSLHASVKMDSSSRLVRRCVLMPFLYHVSGWLHNRWIVSDAWGCISLVYFPVYLS